MSDKIDNLTLDSNKQNHPGIIPPENPIYYLDAAEYNELIDTVNDLISRFNQIQAGGGNLNNIPIIVSGSNEQPTNKNLFSALKTIEEINKNSGLDSNLYLKRTENDTAEGEIKFENNTYYGDFLQGINGGKIDKHANAELKSLKLREWLEVPELRFNRTSITIGDEIRGPGGGIIEWVDPTTRTLRLKLEDGEYGALEENDLCMGIIHSINPANNSNTTSDDGRNNRTIQGFATVYFKITQQLNPGENNSDFKYELRPGTTIHPEKFLNFGVFGNTLNIHRQYSVYQTRTYTRFLIGMNTWECNFNNIAMQFGDLSNLNTFDQPIGFTGYSIYLNNVYLSGQIQTIKAPYIGEDGYWYYWDFELQQYVKTDSKGESTVINPIKYSLIPKAHAIERLTADTFNPDSIACGLQKATTDLHGETTYENLDVLPNGITLEIRTNETGVLMPYIPDQSILITPEMKSIEFHLRKGNTLLDKQFIPVRESSGLILQVNPQTILCEVDSEGNVLNWSGTKVITCQLIQGLNEELTPTLSVSFPQSVSYTINGNQIIISNISKINGVSMTGIVTATAMFNGASVSRTATIQFTTTGKGENAVIHSIHPDPERVKIFKDGTYEMDYTGCYVVRYDGRFEERLQGIPNDYIVKYNFRYNDGSESQQEEYLNPVYIPSEVSRITYKLYKRTNTNLYISEASTLIVPVGNDGNNGSDGWSNAQVRLEMRSATQPQVPQNPITYNLRSAKITAGNLGDWVHGVAPFEKHPRWVTYALASSQTEIDIIQPNEWSAPIEDSTNLISREIYLYKRAPIDSPPQLPTTTLIYNFETMVLSGNLNGWSQTPEYVQGLVQWRTHAMAVTSGMTDDIEPSEWATPPYIHAQDGQDGEGSVVVDATSETLTLIIDASNNIIGGNDQIVTYGMLFGSEDIEVTHVINVLPFTGVFIETIKVGNKKGIKFKFDLSGAWITQGMLDNKMFTINVEITGVKDGVTTKRVRTITFILQQEVIGASGKDATIYSLHTTQDALMLDKNNNWIGASSFDVKVKETKGDITTILNDFPTGYSVMIQIDSQTPYSYNNYPISPPKTTNRIRLELKKGQTLVDTETIPIIKQGKDGKDGVDGTNGKDGVDGTNGLNGLGSWTVMLTNEFSVVKVNDSNNVISGYPISTKIKLYYGTDLYPIYDVHVPSGGSNEVVNVNWNSNTGTLNITAIKDGSASNKEVIEIPITITAIKDGITHTLEKTLIVAKLRDGEQGPAGLSVPLVFRGEWVIGDTHFGTENRRDLVKVTTQSTASYYMTNTSLPVEGLIASNSNKPGTPRGNNYWIPFDGSYQSIATGLLLAEKANIGGFAFSGQTKASKVPANSIISQFGVNWNSKANVDLTKEQSIIDQFLPNLTLNGEYGYIQMRDSILLNSDGSGYVANNNFKWDQLGNIHIGPLKAGRYYESALDVTGKQMWVEFSKEGYSYWHFPHTSADRFMRVKIQGGHWSEPHLYRPGTEGSAPNRRVYAHDMDKIHYKYQFATTTSDLSAIDQDEPGVVWNNVIPTVATNRFLWFKRQIYNPSTQSYDDFERPCRITPEGGHKAEFLHPIHFKAEDGSGWMANGNLNWNSSGDLNLNHANLQNATVVGHIEASSGEIGSFNIGDNYIGTKQSTTGGIPGAASSGFSLYNDFLKFSENKTMTGSENGYNKSVFLGINTFSVLSGSTAMARFQSEIIQTPYSSSVGNIGIYFKMSGASNYDDNPGFGNHALYIQEGTVVGLRPRLRRVNGFMVNISRLDTTLVVTKKDTNLWVPSGNEALDAQLYYIWPSGYSGVNIKSNKPNIYSRLNTSGTNNHSISDFKWHLLIYDKVNDRWMLGWGT